MNLTVHEIEVPCHKMSKENGKRDFGGIRAMGEHGFSEEGSAKGDAVEASDELPVFPRFDAMGETEAMKFLITGFERGSDPCPSLPRPLCPSAFGDHCVESRIGANFERATSKSFGKRSTDVSMRRDEYKARIG